MSGDTLQVSATRHDMRQALSLLPAILSGREPDTQGIAEGFKLRLATSFFLTIKTAFLAKAHGGVDEAGQSWPPLTEKYLAYGRGPAGTRRAGKRSPGLTKNGKQKDGYMTAAQLKRWKQIYARVLAQSAASMPLAAAKGKAAAVAWSILKREGVQTKLEVFGHRQVDILKDRGVLYNSLSPGVLTEQGAAATYTPAHEDQICDTSRPGELVCGTDTKYAPFHHFGKRRLWPRPDSFPEIWWQEWLHTCMGGLVKAAELVAGRN